MSERPSPAAESAVTLFRAGPGAGKTAFLVRQAQEALAAGASPARVLCLALDGAAAEALERRFLEAAVRGEPLALPQVRTYEQIARSILTEAHGDTTGRFLDPLTERLLVGRALAATAAQARRFREPALRESPRFRDDVADFIAELKRHKISWQDFRERILPGLPEVEALADLADVYQRYQQWVQDALVYDLRGLLWLALIALEERSLAASWQGRFDLVLADDLQDATPLHLELLAVLLGPNTALAVAYEPAQTVYRFRGAVSDPEPFLRRWLPRRKLTRETASAREGDLPLAVADVARRFAAHYGLSLPPLGCCSDHGEVAYSLYRSREAELSGLADFLIAALEHGKLPPQEIAVLTRSHEQAQRAAQYLALRGLPVAGSEGAPGLWEARRLLGDALTVIAAQRHPSTAPGAQATTRQRVQGALCRLAQVIADPDERWRLPRICAAAEDLLAACPGDETPALSALTAGFAATAGEEPLSALCHLARHLIPHLPAGHREEIIGPLLALLGRMEETDRHLWRLTGAPLTVAELETVLAEADLRPPFSAPGISVLTAHQSRGQRFRLVYVVGLEEEVFPAPPAASRLLSPAALRALRERVSRALALPPGTLALVGLGEVPEEVAAEEQRLFLTCLTRSRERLVLSAHLEAGGAPLLPSPFLAAALPEDFRLPERAVSADFQCPFAGLAREGPAGRRTHQGCPVQPCAASGEITRPQPLPATAGRRQQSVRPVLAGAAGLSLSPSSLSKYLRCPRRFFLERLLAVAPAEEADHLTYGKAVHRFLAALNHRPPEARTPQTARRLLAEALTEAAPRFSSPLAADLYRRLAEAALQVYLRTPAAQARTILPERYLRFELKDRAGDHHRFVGKVDVVMELDDGVAVVDYKTGAVDSAKKLRERIPLDPSDVGQGHTGVQLPMYALAWEFQPGLPDLRRLCLLGFSAAEGCKMSCVWLGSGPKETETLNREDLARFRDLLAEWAREIKHRRGFPGNAPEEGCRAFVGGCPFVSICDEAELP